MEKRKQFFLFVLFAFSLLQNTSMAQKVKLDRVVVMKIIDDVSDLHFLDSLSEELVIEDCKVIRKYISVIRNRIAKHYKIEKNAIKVNIYLKGGDDYVYNDNSRCIIFDNDKNRIPEAILKALNGVRNCENSRISFNGKPIDDFEHKIHKTNTKDRLPYIVEVWY